MTTVKILTGLLLTLAILACGTDKPSVPTPAALVSPVVQTDTALPTPTVSPEPTPMTFTYSSSFSRDHWGASTASMEGRVYQADVVVRARLVSAGNDVLRFRAISYLKGTGPTVFTVSAETEGRDTQWDNQDAILFLLEYSGTEDFEFVDTTEWRYYKSGIAATTYTGNLPDGFTLGTNNPVWVPVISLLSTSTTRSVRSGESRIQLEPQGTNLPPLYATESALQDAINWIAGPPNDLVTKSLGADSPTSEEYNLCVTSGLRFIRDTRDLIAHGVSEDDAKVYRRPVELESGLAAGAVVIPFNHYFREPAYFKSSIRGANRYIVSHTDDDNTDPSDGFDYSIITTRPIPAGHYEAKHNMQPSHHQACDFAPEDVYMLLIMTVTPPPGTIHEAIFDPATTTTGVGYFTGATTTGVLKPAEFSVGGVSTTITGLKWGGGSVVLSLSPFVSLGGQQLEFIALDGTLDSGAQSVRRHGRQCRWHAHLGHGRQALERGRPAHAAHQTRAGLRARAA